MDHVLPGGLSTPHETGSQAGHAALGSSVARAGATRDEVADVLLAIALVAGLGRVVSAGSKVAAALDYDIDAALEEPGGL